MKDDYDGTIGMMLHILRNPYGWNEETVRKVRLDAADFIEEFSKWILEDEEARHNEPLPQPPSEVPG